MLTAHPTEVNRRTLLQVRRAPLSNAALCGAVTALMGVSGPDPVFKDNAPCTAALSGLHVSWRVVPAEARTGRPAPGVA